MEGYRGKPWVSLCSFTGRFGATPEDVHLPTLIVDIETVAGVTCRGADLMISLRAR
jgi:hypothetical protein